MVGVFAPAKTKKGTYIYIYIYIQDACGGTSGTGPGQPWAWVADPGAGPRPCKRPLSYVCIRAYVLLIYVIVYNFILFHGLIVSYDTTLCYSTLLILDFYIIAHHFNLIGSQISAHNNSTKKVIHIQLRRLMFISELVLLSGKVPT